MIAFRSQIVTHGIEWYLHTLRTWWQPTHIMVKGAPPELPKIISENMEVSVLQNGLLSHNFAYVTPLRLIFGTNMCIQRTIIMLARTVAFDKISRKCGGLSLTKRRFPS